MDDAKLEAILREIQLIWQNTELEIRPWGIWICCYPEITNGNASLDYGFDTPIHAWFLEQGHLTQKSVLEYVRFYFVLVVQPWCSRSIPEVTSILNRDMYSIGFANFARIGASNTYYLHWQFKGLLGQSFTFKFDEHNEIIDRNTVCVS